VSFGDDVVASMEEVPLQFNGTFEPHGLMESDSEEESEFQTPGLKGWGYPQSVVDQLERGKPEELTGSRVFPMFNMGELEPWCSTQLFPVWGTAGLKGYMIQDLVKARTPKGKSMLGWSETQTKVFGSRFFIHSREHFEAIEVELTMIFHNTDFQDVLELIMRELFTKMNEFGNPHTLSSACPVSVEGMISNIDWANAVNHTYGCCPISVVANLEEVSGLFVKNPPLWIVVHSNQSFQLKIREFAPSIRLDRYSAMSDLLLTKEEIRGMEYLQIWRISNRRSWGEFNGRLFWIVLFCEQDQKWAVRPLELYGSGAMPDSVTVRGQMKKTLTTDICEMKVGEEMAWAIGTKVFTREMLLEGIGKF